MFIPLFRKLATLQIAIVVTVSCFVSTSRANLRAEVQVEEQACLPLTAANEALAKLPGFQTVYDAVLKDETQQVRSHLESVIDHGLQYVRRGPYLAWHVSPAKLVSPQRSDCHRLREEMLDGVRTAVISYYKHDTYGTRAWRCTTWVELPTPKNRKMECASVYPPGRVKTSVRWFYRSDIKPPVASKGQ
jgi:hypothetical protein